MLTIMLDAGHGKDTAGKRSPDGSLREWYFNCDVAKRVEAKIKQYKDVVVHRLYDVDGRDVPLSERTRKANSLKGSGENACVSIHANAFGSGGWNSANGIETFSYDGHSPNGDALAAVIQKHMIKATGRPSRGHKRANFHMVREPIMASALVECEFMTNKEGNELLKSDSYRETCADAIVDALVEHYSLKKGGVSKPASKPSAPSKAPAKSNVRYLNLHKHMSSWNHYSTKVQPVKRNADKTPLRPAKFGGLSYKIEGNPYPDVYTIRTGQFGLRNIYAPRDRDSSITSKPLYK